MVDGHQVPAPGDRVLVGGRDRQAAGGEMELRGRRAELRRADGDYADANNRADQGPTQEDVLVYQ
jgi:hypothetical protein